VKLWKYYVLVYVNGKTRCVGIVLGMGGRENDGGGEFNYDIYYKNFYKCHSVPAVQQ
jgi:hypothetical protein